MKATGVIRPLDEVGRITLPMELRKSLNLTDRAPMEIFVDDDSIVLKKYNPTDIFTGSSDNLVDYHGKKVSIESIKELASLAGLSVKENKV